MYVICFPTSYKVSTSGTSSKQRISETVLKAEIGLRTFLVDQTLDLVHPPLPLFIVDEIIRPFKEVVGQDPKSMLSICTTSGLLSIDPGSKLVLNLRVTKTERNLSTDRRQNHVWFENGHFW